MITSTFTDFSPEERAKMKGQGRASKILELIGFATILVGGVGLGYGIGKDRQRPIYDAKSCLSHELGYAQEPIRYIDQEIAIAEEKGKNVQELRERFSKIEREIGQSRNPDVYKPVLEEFSHVVNSKTYDWKMFFAPLGLMGLGLLNLYSTRRMKKKEEKYVVEEFHRNLGKSEEGGRVGGYN